MKFVFSSSSLWLPIYCILLVIVHTYCSRNLKVRTKYGPVVGIINVSRYGRSYSSFRGIPYAKPPVGELRFRAPQPPTPWTTPINATQDAPYCIQKNYFFADPKVEGKEDCLYLNIYVPELHNRKTLLPVMVFIHWGGFFAGSGASGLLGPEYIMDKDVILVTFNYRLGVFGFFSTLDDSAPGNFGLKDQVMALQFVQDNIKSFGGDSERVTIFGQSAGGGSVDLHTISPSSKGLFHRAISQSGVALNLWAKPQNVLQPVINQALASFVGCTEYLNNSVSLVTCLRKIDAFDLAETADKFKYFTVEPYTPYTLVTEKKTTDNPYPFLTKDPLKYIQDNEFEKIPWIVGNTQDEGILRVSQLVRQPDTLKQLNANFSDLLPKMLGVSLSVPPNSTELFTNIVNFYLGGKYFIDKDNPASIQGFIDLYTDKAFTYGTFQSLILKSQKGDNPIWFYNFDYRGQYTYGDLFASTSNDINFTWGVSHCDDLLYLFRSPALFPKLQSHNDLCISDYMVTLWTNFAIYGDPDPDRKLKWKSLNFDNVDIKNNNLLFLNISGHYKKEKIEFKIQKGFNLERMQFWINQNISENFPGLS